jgi:hypothetical protein
VTNLYVILSAALLLVFGLSTSAQSGNPNTDSWFGIIINNNCSADEAFSEASKCTQKDVPGAKYVLYDDTTRQMFLLDPQEPAVGHLGDSMIASGTLEGDTIHLTSLKLHTATEIGLAVGQKAPAFSAPDQFGRQQNLETLKGPKGTVLLFFRSADW